MGRAESAGHAAQLICFEPESGTAVPIDLQKFIEVESILKPYSVLMTVWAKDDPNHLALSLQSMIDQTKPSDDLVLVKDGPLTPELERVISKFQAECPSLHPVALPLNVGLGEALNAGLAHCRNDLVARMDADDIALPERCALQVDAFAKDPSLDIVGGYAFEFSGDNQASHSLKTVPLDPASIYRYGRRRNPFIHPTVMYKKGTILTLGGYSRLRRGQDMDLFSRLLHAGCKAQNLPVPLIHFRSGEDLYKRRKSWKASQNYIATIYRSWRMGYASLTDLLIATTGRLTMLLLPVPVLKLLYRKVLRRRGSTK
jgi:glycosyltransferase involved in cell wall biosynthesis